MDDQGKAQWVRVADVFVIGPLMLWAGLELGERKHPARGTALALIGLATVAYNGLNYIRLRGQP